MKVAYLSLTLLLTLCLVSKSQLKFTDVTSDAGIDHYFEVYEGMFGGGAVVFDYNKDGFEDLYITGGVADDALYKNNGNGTFTNIFAASGISTKKFVTQGVASADVNKDGWADLFITTVTRKDTTRIIPRAENLLYLNNGDGTFRNATREFRIERLQSFSTGANFGDINEDGYPDLFIGNYFQDFDGSLASFSDESIVNSNQAAQPYLLINEGGKYFRNAIRDYEIGYKGFGFGGVFTDFDNDNDLDLYINNDFGFKAKPNVMLRNDLSDEALMDISKSSGLDLKINAMGTAIGDYDNNGKLDYYVTNIRFNHFMVNNGRDVFEDRSKEVGMDFVSVSWGANFADFDNDKDLDLFVANGDLNPNDIPLADYFFENRGKTFKEIAPQVGLNDYGIGRGSVVFDMDNDGDLDLLVVNQKSVQDYPVPSITKLYRNDSKTGNWLKVQLSGKSTDSNGIGSRVTIVADGIRMMREIDGGSSHLSQNSSIAHFGIGDASGVDSVHVQWLDGSEDVLVNVPANRLIVVAQKDRPKESSVLPMVIGGILLISLVAIVARKLFMRHSTVKAA